MNSDVLLRFLSAAPMALLLPLYAAGIFLSIVNWRRIGLPAKLVLAGCALNLITLISLPLAMSRIVAQNNTATDLHLRIVIAQSIQTFIVVIGWGMVLSAVFIGRPRNPGRPH